MSDPEMYLSTCDNCDEIHECQREYCQLCEICDGRTPYPGCAFYYLQFEQKV
jgi:hypothetical protein